MGSVGENYSKSNFVKRAKSRTQDSYDNIYEDLEKDPSLLDGLNIKDTDLVEQYAKALLEKFHRVPGGVSCYAVAGAVAAILDKSGEPNTVIAGITEPNSTETTSSIQEPNHVWVKSRYGIYEYFKGYSSSQLTQHIRRTDIQLKRRGKK